MTFQTDRLLIRELSVADLQNIHNLHSLPETDQFNTLGIPDTIETTRRLLTEWLSLQQADPRAYYIWVIDHAENRDFTGLIALQLGKANYRTAEVWYKLHPSCWGKGYATEALIKVLAFGFTDLNLHRIEAGCAVDNTASVKVLEKAGFRREGRKRKKLPVRGEWMDNYFYAILEEDFTN